MKTELSAITFKATSHPEHRFQNLYGQLDSDLLYQSWSQLNKQTAAGIDRINILEYQSNLLENIKRLEEELRTKQYRSSDIKRVFIPKANGKQRPLGLPTVDDKIVQQSVSQRYCKVSGNRTFCETAMVILRAVTDAEFITC